MASFEREGRTVDEIALEVGRSRDTVRAHLTVAKTLLRTRAPEVAEQLLEAISVGAAKGRYRGAMELLEKLGVLPPRQVPVAPAAAAPSVVVQMAFKMPGLPEQASQTIDLAPMPVPALPGATSED